MSKKKTNPASLRELWLLSYPLIVTMAAHVVMQFVDRMFLAHYSHEALAACVPAGVLAMTFGSLFMGLAGYTSVFISQYYAKKKFASVTISLWQGFFLALLSWAILAACTPAGNALIKLFNHGAQVTPLELKYFTLLNLFGGLPVVNYALSGFFSGRGKTLVPMYVTLAGNVLNIVLDYIFIFGKFGFEPMGIIGAAWATVLGAGAMTLIYVGLIFGQKTRRNFRITQLAGVYKPVLTRLVRFGVEASNVVMSLQPVVFTVILGLGGGIQILVSKYQGLKRPDLSVRVVKQACKIGFGYAGAVGVLFFCAAPFWVSLFIAPSSVNAAEIAAKAVPLMKLISAFVLFDATYLIFGEAIRGAGDTKFYMRVMMGCAWGLLVPGTWVLVDQLRAPVFWVWSWLTFYAGVTALFMFARFWQGKWKKMEITKA